MADETKNRVLQWEVDDYKEDANRSANIQRQLESEIVKYLMIANGGLCISLATWLQSCLSVAASTAQREMALSLIHGMTLGATGVIATVLIPWAGTRIMRQHRLMLGSLRRKVDFPSAHFKDRRLRWRAILIRNLWGYVWKALCAISVFLFVAALLAVREGAMHSALSVTSN